MPSAAAAKLEKQASTEAVEPIKQAIVIIEHKIRNLEKRKRKIESYREEQKNGKELNADQLNAVAKFDEVQLTLEFARDLCKQFTGISLDAAKTQKKQARKEALERVQQEISKVKEILLIQDVLQNIGTESARDDFLAGRNGAAQLTEEDLKYLDDIYLEVFPKRGNEDGLPPFLDQVQTSAEHLLSIVDGKSKEVVGTTYIKLKELVQSIHGCGYFDQNVEETTEVAQEAVPAATPPATVAAPPDELVEEEETFLVESQTVLPSESQTFVQAGGNVAVAPLVVAQTAPQPGPQPVPQPGPPPTAMTTVAQAPVVPTPVQANPPLVQPPAIAPVPTPVAAVESSFFSTSAATFVPAQPALPQSRPLNEVIGSGNFNFLQDSELDSPDISVMLSGTPGQPTAQHMVPNPAPANPVAVTPIPSQTFTNQNFVAVSTPAVQSKVVFQTPNEMAHHIPGFATTTPNPPPPIPMPPGHQIPGATPRPGAVHQIPPGSFAAAGGVPAHTYAAQAQQHTQPQTQPITQPQPVQPQLQQPPAAQPQTVPSQPVSQVQAPVVPVQPSPAQPVPAQTVPSQPVPAQPQSLPSAGFSSLKTESIPEATKIAESSTNAPAEENLDDWASGDVSQGDWSHQSETNANDWAQSGGSDEWTNSGNNQNDGYTVQGGSRNYNGRGRGSRGGRGSSNGYTGRGRGNYQNGRGGSGGYGYRSEERSNNYYQNGYQRDSYNGNYKRGGRGGSGGTGGGNMRGGVDRGNGNARGGMDRGGMRTGGNRGGNTNRGNRQGNFSRGGGNKQ